MFCDSKKCRGGVGVLLLFLSVICLAPAGQAATTVASLQPEANYGKVQRDIIGKLKYQHYLHQEFDDDFSSRVLDRYLSLLDDERVYFLASDVAEFEKYRTRLDDALGRGDLGPAYEIFNRFQVRLVERLDFLLGLIDKGEALRFDTDETVLIDREKAPWPADQAAMDDLWRRRLKAAVLGLKLSGKPLEESLESVGKRYRNQLGRTQQTRSEDVFQTYMNAVTLCFDPHTQYFSPKRSEDFDINMRLSLEGIGALLRADNEHTKVVSLIAGGPAEKGKQLKPADRIVGVGQGPDGEIVDVVGWRLDEVVDMIRGPKGSTVRLEVIPAASEDVQVTKVISIVRDEVKLEDQAAHSKILEVERDGRTYRFGVIDVPAFYMDFRALHAGSMNYKSTTHDVDRFLKEFVKAGVDGVLLDLRDNGGGSLQEANSLSGLFIKRGPTVQIRMVGGEVEVLRDPDPAVSYEGPLVVLTNRLSASASEIFAGVVKDYGRGIIIGEPTFGKGTVQTMLTLQHGQLKVTTAKFYRVSGESTQHKGVEPDLYYPSLYDADKVGESALDDAMGWDRIRSVRFSPFASIDQVLPQLRERYEERITTDPDYVFLKERLQFFEEMRAKQELSLNEEVRRREQDEADQRQLAMENRKRLAKNQEPLAKLDEEEDEEAEEAHSQNGEVKADDPLVQEGLQVLADFIGLTGPGQVARAAE